MNFSRAAMLETAILYDIRRAKVKAVNQQPDFKIKHADWCKDATRGDFTILTKTLRADTKKRQEKNETFTRKLHQDG